MKKIIRLTESDLTRLIKIVINEDEDLSKLSDEEIDNEIDDVIKTKDLSRLERYKKLIKLRSDRYLNSAEYIQDEIEKKEKQLETLKIELQKRLSK
jgi:hypothetical protein